MDRIVNAAREFHIRHERLKNYVHTGFRYPLPKWGRWTMGFIYFSIPVVSGWFITDWAVKKSHENIGERGEKLKVKEIQGIGDKRMVDGKLEKVGAGGWGGGVRLAVSDQQTQEQNMKLLQKFLKKQRKLKRKRELEAKRQQEEAERRTSEAQA